MSGVMIAASWSNSHGEQWDIPTDDALREDQFTRVADETIYVAVVADKVTNTEASRDQATGLWSVKWISPTGVVTLIEGFNNEEFAEQLERAYTHSVRLLPARPAPVEVEM